MILFHAKVTGVSTVSLEVLDTGYWLSFSDPSFAAHVEERTKEILPQLYLCQLAEFNPIWKGAAYATSVHRDFAANRVKVLLSDGRVVLAGGSDKNCEQIESWLHNEVGLV